MLLPINHPKQNGITIDGGNGQGSQLSEFSWPKYILIDDDNQYFYVLEKSCSWGKNSPGNQSNQPMDIILDQSNDSFIISDWENRRVVQWPRKNGKSGQTIISNVDCYRLAMDSNGDIYISEAEENRAKRWNIQDKSRIIVAGENRRGDQLNHLTYIFVDHNHSIYVSDNENHRVVKWIKDAEEGIIVASGNGKGNELTQLSHPMGIVVDQMGILYVADSHNNRIMCWPEGSNEGFIIAGGNGKGKGPDQFHCPVGLSFDRQGNLYVVDSDNGRIQRFDLNLEYFYSIFFLLNLLELQQDEQFEYAFFLIASKLYVEK